MSGKGMIEKMLTNTGLIQPDQDADNGLKNYRYIVDNQGYLRPLLPLLENEDHDKIRVWCQHGVCLGDTLILSFIKVEMIPQSQIVGSNEMGEVLPVNFKVLGSGLAVGDKKTMQFQRVFHNGNDIFWPENVPHFGSAIYADPDTEKLYLYGVVNGADHVQRCSLGRVDFDSFEDLDTYEYLTSKKPGWSPDVKDATSLFTDVPSEMSISYNEHLGVYLAVHSWRTSKKVVGRTAPHLWGPWSEPTTLWNVQLWQKRNIPYPRLIYAGKEHPELARDDGKTSLTLNLKNIFRIWLW